MPSVVILAVAAACCFVAYLVFCAFAVVFVVMRTGSTSGLRDVAVVIRASGVPSGSPSLGRCRAGRLGPGVAAVV